MKRVDAAVPDGWSDTFGEEFQVPEFHADFGDDFEETLGSDSSFTMDDSNSGFDSVDSSSCSSCSSCGGD